MSKTEWQGESRIVVGSYGVTERDVCSMEGSIQMRFSHRLLPKQPINIFNPKIPFAVSPWNKEKKNLIYG